MLDIAYNMMAHLHCMPDFDNVVIGHMLYWNSRLESDLDKIEQERERRASLAASAARKATKR